MRVPVFLIAYMNKVAHYKAVSYVFFENTIRPEFFYFSFYRPSRPNFLKIETKNRRDCFRFYFFLFHRLILKFNYVFRFVFSTAARLIKLPPVTAPGEILPF